jgi:hypothetical protein
VDWSDRSSAPRRTRHVGSAIEDEIVRLRFALREDVLGEYGAAAIRRALAERWPPEELPSIRTIVRVLSRRGLLDGAARIRRPAPPRGWYLPDVAARQTELDSFDVVEGHYVRGAEVDVLTGVSLHGGLVVAWPGPPVRSALIVARLVEHWSDVGLPGYAQFDNDSRFHGSAAYTDLLSPVVRLCLSLSVVAVFAPPREHGFQAAVEQFNGQWQAKVFNRRRYAGLEELATASRAYVVAHRSRRAVRIQAAPYRPSMPPLVPPFERDPRGKVVFLRRTTDAGRATVLGRPYEVDPRWPHRLVRAELDLTNHRLSFFALRRREPTDQPLLAVHTYEPIRRHT